MSESKDTPPKKLSRRTAALVGLVVAFVIALLVNVVVGKLSFRADLTEYGVYTLSEGTSNILSRLETPVELRYYVTDDAKVMSPNERTRAQRVSDLLAEFARKAPSKEIEVTDDKGEFVKRKVKMLTVKKLNPEPNTDAEDSAMIDGLRAGVSPETNNEVYFGIAIQCLDSVEAIPFVPAKPETSLEYDLARAISGVHGGKTKKIAVMTSLPVGGGFGGNFQAPPQQPWMFYELLGKDYEVETIPPTAAEIPEGTSTLIVVHPYDITDEAQFAIDQYLLQGGNVIAFVDPNFFYARALQQQPQ
ncbi:MAG TPA: GldG family protein, partial [Bacteroidia bacterium]|nr:GldG family protein [Bacteroidia bacterium]